VVDRSPIVAYPTDSLYQALERMGQTTAAGLPVVADPHLNRLVGYLSMPAISRALEQHVSELRVRPEAIRSSFDDPLRYVSVEEAMSDAVVRLSPNTSLAEAVGRLTQAGLHAAVVLTEDGSLDGVVTVTDLETAVTRASTNAPVGEYAARPVVAARPTQTVAQALRQPGAEGLRQLPVLADRGSTAEVVGMLRRQDILAAYLEGRSRITTGGPRRRSLAGKGITSVEVAVERAARANGHTLLELGLPLGVVVTAVHRGEADLIPRGNLRLITGDRVELSAAAGDLPRALQLLRG
jgi:CBS domain-containing protein